MCGLTWFALTTSTVSGNADNIFGDGFSEPVHFPSWAAEIFAYLMSAWLSHGSERGVQASA